MDDLSTLLEHAPKYRNCLSPDEALTSGTLVCRADNIETAQAWLAEREHHDVQLLPVLSKDIQDNITAAQKLATHSRNQNIYIFLENARSVALFVTKCGITEFIFTSNPNYKQVKFDPKYFEINKSDLEKTFSRLEDIESRQTLISVIKYRITGDHGYLRVAHYNEYEHPIVSPKRNEWVIDCGSADGMTSFRFANLAHPFGKVIAVEPDPTNYSNILRKLDGDFGSIKSRTFVEHCAVSDSIGEMKFISAKGGASKLSQEGDLTVKVDTLDRIAERHNLTGPGTISFDVEGFEIAALNGGLKTIQNLRPKLQISAYHKNADLVHIPQWIDANLENYALFLGHHETYHTETDYYAIPRELLI